MKTDEFAKAVESLKKGQAIKILRLAQIHTYEEEGVFDRVDNWPSPYLWIRYKAPDGHIESFSMPVHFSKIKALEAT
jgi:hypothetical protein